MNRVFKGTERLILLLKNPEVMIIYKTYDVFNPAKHYKLKLKLCHTCLI